MTDSIPTSKAHSLCEHLRTLLAPHACHVAEKRMFGGTTFLFRGNMLCCASRSGLMVRVGAAAEPRALVKPHAAPCLGAGRRMAGFIIVAHEGLATRRSIERWLDMAMAYVGTLPAKTPDARLRRSFPRTPEKGSKPA